MISKKSRINRENFENIMKKGGFLNSDLFSMRFLKNPSERLSGRAGPLNSTHFSVVVSKKIAKTAVSRNKIRRRSYSILRKTSESLKSPYFIILFAKKGVEKAEFNEFESNISGLLQKIK